MRDKRRNKKEQKRRLTQEKTLLVKHEKPKNLDANEDGVIIKKNAEGEITEVIWPENRTKVYIPARVAKRIYNRWNKKLHSLNPSPYLFAAMESTANNILREENYPFLQIVCNEKYYVTGKPMGFVVRDTFTKQQTVYMPE